MKDLNVCANVLCNNFINVVGKNAKILHHLKVFKTFCFLCKCVLASHSQQR